MRHLLPLILLLGCAGDPGQGGGAAGGGAAGGGAAGGGAAGGGAAGGSGGGAAGGSAGGAAQRTTVTINFDAVSGSITNQFAPAATFSGSGGVISKQWRGDTNHSPPNFICVSSCVGDLIVDFGQPVRDLRFRMIGVDGSGSAATLTVTAGGQVTTQQLMGSGAFTQPVPVDLSGRPDITRLEVTAITDAHGIGFDDFVFTVP